MRYSHLIWDFDGTLFDTYPPLIKSIEQALADFDIVVPRDQIVALLHGTLSDTLATLSGAHALRVEQLQARVTFYTKQTTMRDRRPFPGAISFLERMLAAGGQNYLVTHRDADSLSALLNWYRVGGLFADIITGDDGFPRKPDPASMTAMIERNNLPRDNVLAIGDRELDVLAGKASRVHTCLINASLPASVSPDYVVTSYDELGSVVRSGSVDNYPASA